MPRLIAVAILGGLAAFVPCQSLAGGAGPCLEVQCGLSMTKTPYHGERYEEHQITDSYRSDFIVGGMVGLRLVDREPLFLEAGLFYKNKGGDTDLRNPIMDARGNLIGYSTTELSWKFAYLTIPFLVRASTIEEGIGPYLRVGPELEILLSAKYERPGVPWLGEFDERVEEDIKDSISSIDVGLLLAVGVQIPVGRAETFAELSYTHGLIDIHEIEDAQLEEELKNRAITVSIGVRI